jgi:poly-gamma-glutamate synthesis protein (capsule biosynthesis protein)
VLPHDGIEYIDLPLPETIARYRDFIDYGADGVIASHPHCPQGWEKYKGKPIFYSLGNFFFNSKETVNFKANKPHWYEGLCVVMIISDGKVSWEVINTRNIDNVGIEIDRNEKCRRHNEYLVDLLRNREKYESALKKECKRMTEIQEMPIIDKTMHPVSLKSYTKQAFQNWMKLLKKQKISDDFPLRTLLRNNTRRSVLMRMLK